MTNPRDDLMALADEAEQLVNMGVLNLPLLRSVKLMREMASALRLAASRPAPVDREAVARILCCHELDGSCTREKYNTGSCEALNRVNGWPEKYEIPAILSLLRPAEPVEVDHPALKWSLSDDAKQRISEIDENIRHAAITSPDMKAGGIQPDTSAAVLAERERCARIVERWSLPTIQAPSMWLVDQAGIAAAIRQLPTPERGDK